MEQTLDLCFANDNDIYININENIDITITCIYFLDIDLHFFDFTPYTGATLIVKDESESVIMTFSTLDGSIILKDGGIFELIKDNNELSGKYNYQMSLSSLEDPDVEFISGKIIF